MPYHMTKYTTENGYGDFLIYSNSLPYLKTFATRFMFMYPYKLFKTFCKYSLTITGFGLPLYEIL